jgi:hypothetical protein
MRLSVTVPDVRKEVARLSYAYNANIDIAGRDATDQAARDLQQALKRTIRSVGLGRLGGAVGYTSAKRKNQTQGKPYGVVYARGGDESLAGGALESYSRGSTIRANNKKWLAFATDALPRKVGRYRLTPELYVKSGLGSSIGKLEFRPIDANHAVLVIKRVTLHPKTGRAKKAGVRAPRTRIAAKEIVAFVLIRETRRAQRFDKDAIAFKVALNMPHYMAVALARRMKIVGAI